jgi:hypothetical protein
VPWEVYARYVELAIRRGRRRLLEQQSDDGFWRDYALPPGQSEAWTTSWVGCALIAALGSPDVDAALSRAGAAVREVSGAHGWGYNRRMQPDADSSAWALRFLSGLGHSFGRAASECLGRYLDPTGAAHTFVGDAGTWGGVHADVTPIAGLALLSTSAPGDVVRRVRRAVLAHRDRGGVWRSFWWATDAYATAWSVRFLDASGGVPPAVACDSEGWLRRLPAAANGFESAHRLLVATTLGLAGTEHGAMLVDELLTFADHAGGWKPSAVLLVPPRTPGGSTSAPGRHRDEEGLMTTAVAIAALTGWLYTVRPDQQLQPRVDQLLSHTSNVSRGSDGTPRPRAESERTCSENRPPRTQLRPENVGPFIICHP